LKQTGTSLVSHTHIAHWSSSGHQNSLCNI